MARILYVSLPSPHPGIDLAANMIGRTNARRGARRMFAVLQNRRLNQHLAYTILDEVRVFLVTRLAISQQHFALSSVARIIIPGGIFMTLFVYSAPPTVGILL